MAHPPDQPHPPGQPHSFPPVPAFPPAQTYRPADPAHAHPPGHPYPAAPPARPYSPAPAPHRRLAHPTLRRWRLRLAGATVFAVAAGVTAALGGFDQVVPPPVDPIPVAVGEQFDGGFWLVTIESAEMGYNLRDFQDSGEDRTLVLQVNARVEVTDDRTRRLSEVVDLEGVDGVRESIFNPSGVSLRDNSPVDALQPGLPVRVAFLWSLDAQPTVPGSVTVLVNSHIRRDEFFAFTGDTIEADEPPGSITVPVQDRTGTT